MHRSEHQPGRQCRGLVVGPPRPVHRIAQFGNQALQRGGRELEPRGRGLVQGTLDDRDTGHAPRACRALERRSEELAFERVRPNVIVADRRRIDGAAYDQRDATHPLSATVFTKESGEGAAGDPLDDAPEAPLDLWRVGGPGAHHGVVRLTRRRNGWIGEGHRPAVDHAGGAGRAGDEHDGRPAGLDAAAENCSL